MSAGGERSEAGNVPQADTPGLALRAAGLTVFACVFFAAANALAKAAQIGTDIPPQQVTFFRYLFGFLTLLPWILAARGRVFYTRVPHIHALRVLFGMSGVVCMFTALAYLPLADVTAIAWANPLVAMLLAALFLGDRISGRRWLYALIGFLGVVVMMQPSGEAFGWAGLFALGAALLIGAEVATIRALAQRDSALTVLAIANAGGCLAAFLIAAPVLVTPDPWSLAAMAGTGCTMVIGQMIFMAAMQLRETSFVAPFYYTTLLFAFVYGMIFFGEIPQWYVYLGAGAIVFSGIAITLQGAREARLRAGRRS
ncbi:MAG: DMT family transporter [Salinarimonas sp.]